MSGKGSSRRPTYLPLAELAARWDAAFGVDIHKVHARLAPFGDVLIADAESGDRESQYIVAHAIVAEQRTPSSDRDAAP